MNAPKSSQALKKSLINTMQPSEKLLSGRLTKIMDNHQQIEHEIQCSVGPILKTMHRTLMMVLLMFSVTTAFMIYNSIRFRIVPADVLRELRELEHKFDERTMVIDSKLEAMTEIDPPVRRSEFDSFKKGM